MPLLKLDVKFDFPMYNGELDVQKLHNWIKQIELYYRVKKMMDEESTVQLDTLQL